MKLKKKEKKEYKFNRILSICCFFVYAGALLYIRFINYIENLFLNKNCFNIVSMFVVIVIIFLNCIMCISGWTNKELYNIINDFSFTNNKNEIKKQRDILLKIIRDTNYSKKTCITIICFEVVACMVVYVLFVQDAVYANLVTGLIIDIETALMAFMFYADIHYKFKVRKNLEQ